MYLSQGKRESRLHLGRGTAQHGTASQCCPPWPGLVWSQRETHGEGPHRTSNKEGDKVSLERDKQKNETRGGTGGGRGCTGGNRQGDDDRARKGNREQRRVMDADDDEANLDGV